MNDTAALATGPASDPIADPAAAKGARREAGPFAPGASTLAAAARAVSSVVHDGRSADVALAEAETRPDRAAVRAITLGTLRWYLRLAPAVAGLVARPPDDLAPPLRALLVTAAHQIEHSRGAPEVSVHLAVDAARALGLERATGLVNAVLRRFVRERATIFGGLDRDLAVRSAQPAWLAAAVQAAWPEHAAAVLEASNAHPPFVLRVAGDRDAYLAELAAAGHEARAVPWAPEAVVLAVSVPVTALPGFREGRVSVQDAGAQLAARLLDVQPGQRVLDACAAPGGKTAHLLQRSVPPADLLAVDVDGARLSMVASTLELIVLDRVVLERSGISARLRVTDLAVPGALGDEPLFDRILVDAPCSSTGVIRRHPDIKLLRRAEDIDAFARTQARLLENCFARLAPGGRLVYATCSLLPAENEAVVSAFLAREPAAEVLPWPQGVALPPGALRLPVGVQLLPGAEAGTDGFYYACLGRGVGA
ncbi:MAG: 16S rRNA (cytosine(967)-C(5))-methyltransferase RsmB [Gammaproteobacteria bacterium]